MAVRRQATAPKEKELQVATFANMEHDAYMIQFEKEEQAKQRQNDKFYDFVFKMKLLAIGVFIGVAISSLSIYLI